ncbi:autotransporter assembly complex protein TamA [Tepidimonas sp.]|uniref:autotransporter assembly complex protein TamA n=1 Tax=Tepidimonas sp. TaxID=2002775 RepID=UPI0028D46079|nr:BamA/TamA family outer membrane protein [Tepidimonas sp.]
MPRCRANRWRMALWWALCGWICLWPAAMPWAQPTSAAFEVSIDAPQPLAAFLTRHAELQRFKSLPDLSRTELERLVMQAPSNLRELLGTQGYFSAKVEVRLTDEDGPLPQVHIRIDPGPPTRVARLQITLEGDAKADPDAAAQRERLTADNLLAVGQTFTQAAWDDAKARALRTLTEVRYPRARLVNSLADIVPETNEANLYLVLDSGPAHFFGDVIVEGAQRYDAEMARRLVRLAGVRPGQPYDEALLQAAQRRLTDSGYYPSAFVLLAPDGDPAQHPVVARLREAPLQKITIGAGVSTDQGARVTLEHTHHRVPGLGWRALSRLQAERDATTLGLNLTSPVDDKGWQWISTGEWKRQEDTNRVTQSEQLRLGQKQERTALDRSYYLQIDRARVREFGITMPTATSVSANYAWTQRAFDDLTHPQRGYGLAAELGAGVTLTQARKPYLRSRVRWLGIWPLAGASERPSRLALRLEGAAIWAAQDAAVPVSQRFLAGGDQSVRGYAQRDIGVPLPSGGVDAGKLLAITSLEWQRPWWRDGQKTAWESVVFLDAGAVANRAADLRPKIGVGVGARYNSPVGPLQVDLAYGVERKRLRLHLSVGFVF